MSSKAPLTLVNEEFSHCVLIISKMHTIYDTVAKSGRNDLFESHVRLKTIGSASRYRVLIVVNSITRLNLRAVLEVYVTHYQKKTKKTTTYILCTFYWRQIVRIWSSNELIATKQRHCLLIR